MDKKHAGKRGTFCTIQLAKKNKSFVGNSQFDSIRFDLIICAYMGELFLDPITCYVKRMQLIR